MDIKNTDSIKDLYSAKLISAEAYLYCCDNRINTLSNFIALEDSLCSSHVTKEIKYLISCTSSETDENISNIEITAVVDAYQKYKYRLSNRTQNVLRQLESNLIFPSKEFFDFLLHNPDPLTNFKALRNSGYKTADELRDFAGLINEFLETHLTTIETEQQEDTCLSIGECYLSLKQQTSTKAKNILNSLESRHSYPEEPFFAFFKNIDIYSELKFQQGVGTKTIREIAHISDILKSPKYKFSNDNPKEYSQKKNLSLDTPEYIEMCIERGRRGLSVRSLNALDKIYSECSSLKDFCDKILDGKFDFKDVKNVGKKSAQELNEFTLTLKSLLSEYKEDENVVIINIIKKDFNVSADEARLLHEISVEIGHFPLFAAINIYLRRLGRDWAIIEGRVNLFENQLIKDRSILAGQLNITIERVRQLQVKTYDNLIEKIGTWVEKITDINSYKPYCEETLVTYDFPHEINTREGVNFNRNFICKVFQILFPKEYALIGDEGIAFFNTFNKSSRLCLVPLIYSEIFDFNSLRKDIAELSTSKVYEAYSINFDDYLLQFFKSTIDFEQLPEISKLCRNIIWFDDDLIVDNEVLTIEQNATKNIPDLLEDILEENNRVMTLDELYEELEKRHPGMTKDKDALRGSTTRNSNIVCISRSSQYALRKWSDKGIVGGTIRDIAFKFLDESSAPASMGEITGHIVAFRPGTDTKSVYSNLFADTTTRFKFFTYQGLRHVGLTHKEYPIEYQVFLQEEALQRRSFEESIRVLEDFIISNDRFPFSTSRDEEEERLFRFLSVQRGRKKKTDKNLLDIDERYMLNDLEQRLGHLEISKNDFLWNQKYDEVALFMATHGMLPTRSSDLYLYNWIYNQRRALIEGRLNDEQADKIIELDNSL